MALLKYTLVGVGLVRRQGQGTFGVGLAMGCYHYNIIIIRVGLVLGLLLGLGRSVGPYVNLKRNRNRALHVLLIYKSTQ